MSHRQYTIVKADKGYLISDMPEHPGLYAKELYAFSTLKDAQEYLPEIFEPQQPKDKKEKTK